MGVLVILRGDPQTDYGVSPIRFEAVRGEATTPLGIFIEIDPTLPDRLPQFDLRGSDFDEVNVDIHPHSWNRDGFVTAVWGRANPLHPIYNGNDGREVEAELVQRAADAPVAQSQPQYADPSGLANVKVEVELPNGMGVVQTTLQGLLKREEAGIWHRQTQWFSRIDSPDDSRPICGFQTFINQYSFADVIRYQVCPHNDLYDPDAPTGYYEENHAVGGPMYYKRITIVDVPAGWDVVHWNHSPSQEGAHLVKAEQALVDWNNPGGGLRPLENSWHLYAARGTDYVEFALRKISTCPLPRAQECLDGAGIGRVVGGELEYGRRGRVGTMNWRHHDVPDSFQYGGLTGREALRKQMQEHWANALGKIQSGGEFGGYGSRRFGHWHLAGEPVAHQGGAQELIPIVGQYRMREELNSLKAQLAGKIYRQAVGRHHYQTGDVIPFDDVAAANAGKSPYLQPVNDHEFGEWDPNFRADEVALNASLGNIDPGVNRHASGRPVGDRSIMPQNRLHNYPGAGQYVVEPWWSFPFNQNDNAYGPYPGTHDERWNHVLEGGWDLTHDFVFKWLAERQAEHVQECYSQHPFDERGTSPLAVGWYRAEYSLFDCLEAFASDPATQARKYWGGRCEQLAGAAGPRWIHRMFGQFAMGVPMAGRMFEPGPQRTRWRAYFQKLAMLANFRCTGDGFGFRSLGDDSDLGFPFREFNWGIHDAVNRDGAFDIDFQFGAQMWFCKYPAKAIAAGEAIFGIDPDLGGVQDRDWSRIVYGPIKRQQFIADHYRQKVPSQYTLIGSVDEPGVATLDQMPDGNYGGTGNGVEQQPWRVRRSKASERASLPTPTDPNHVWLPQLKATLGSQAVEFWACVAAYGETAPGDIAGIAVLDEIRKVIEGCIEEWTGQRVWLTFQQAYEACFGYWSDSGVGVYWWTWDRPRWGTAAGYMQRAAELLAEHPSWSVLGNDQGRVAMPTGVTCEDTPAGLVVRWTVDPAAATMYLDWGELLSHENGPEHYQAGIANDGEYTIPAAGLPDGFQVNVRLSGEDLGGLQGTSTGRMAITVGSGATVSPAPVGGGGGGTGDDFPATPVLSEATPIAGGLELEITVPPGGQPTVVFGIEVSQGGAPFTQVAYQNVGDLGQSGPTYTVPIGGLSPQSTDVRVRSRAGNANWSNYSDTLTRTPLEGGGGGPGGLPAPENVTMAATGDRITIDWEPVVGAAVYFVGEGPTDEPDNSWTWHWFGYGGPLAVFAPVLPAPGVDRFFAIAAHDGVQLGQASEVWRIVMPNLAEPAQGGGGGPQPPADPNFSNPTQEDGQVGIDIS